MSNLARLIDHTNLKSDTKNHPVAGPGDHRRRAGGQRLSPSHTDHDPRPRIVSFF